MSKHTPGPWRVYHENGSMGSGGHWGIEKADESGAVVLRMHGGPNARHDAALIAAAPAMRDALEGLLAVASESVGPDCPYCNAEGSWSEKPNHPPRMVRLVHREHCAITAAVNALASAECAR